MQDPVYGLPRILLLRTPVNRGAGCTIGEALEAQAWSFEEA
jgi:hypothetical protein